MLSVRAFEGIAKFMRKLFPRIVVLFLVPCLLVDSGFATIPAQSKFHPLATFEFFQEKALELPLTEVRSTLSRKDTVATDRALTRGTRRRRAGPNTPEQIMQEQLAWGKQHLESTRTSKGDVRQGERKFKILMRWSTT
jgi:hypothetical protein